MNGLGTITRHACLLALLVLLLPLSWPAQATTPEEVRTFVHNIYIEGVPYEEASQLPAEVALPVLQEVLHNPKESEYWANAAVTIGMIGDDRGVKILTDFITRKEAKTKLNRAQTVAKTSAVMSLGYIVNKTGNRTALEFLTKRVDPQAWSKQKLNWNSEFHRTATERNLQLATMAILGLGVSGNPEAAETLRSLQAAPTTPQLRTLKKAMPDVDSIAAEALKANSEIAKEGMRNYNLKIQPKHAPEESRVETRVMGELEVVKPPVAGEILKAPQPGEVLRTPQPGEVVAPAKTGTVIKPVHKGEIIKNE